MTARDSKPTGARKKRAPSGTAARRAVGAAQPCLEDVLRARSGTEIEELYRFWGGSSAPEPPEGEREVLGRVRDWMTDADVLSERIGGLGKRHAQVLAHHLRAPSYRCAVEELRAARALSYLSEFEMEAALETLRRHGLLAPCQDRRFKSYGGKAHAIPVELGDGLLRAERSQRRGVFDLLTLRGHLDRLNEDPSRKRRIAPTRLREMYKMYTNESAAVARLERLPEELGGLVEKAVLEFGGLLPRGLFDRMETDLAGWNGPRWRQDLEESLVGTVHPLDLSRYGIQHNDDVLVVFNEVALAWLKRIAVPGDPDQPDSEAALGVDLVSNISRFIGFIIEHNVRFTVRGEIFKTTEKRILQELIPNPGRELSRDEVLHFIYEFTRSTGLIESTGERTFAMTTEGRRWEQKPLDDKLEALVEYAVEERDLAGDFYHQLRLRRIFLRLLKRVEAGTWYDIMYLPFLARNTYLSSLDQLAVDEYFEARVQSGSYAPMEDLQRLAWNLVTWVRKRLYLLGIVDMGYDRSNRPVALRLTRQGARLLGVEGDTPQITPLIGSLVITPDFEVVLFPTGDDAELVHELDRFCVREKAGETLHFRIHERSVHRALSEGMYLSRILNTLRSHSRTPVPQNVIYSIRDWAHRAGLLVIDKNGVICGEDADTMKRFRADPGVKAYIREELDERRIQLKTRFTPRRMQSLLRELDFLVEVEVE